MRIRMIVISAATLVLTSAPAAATPACDLLRQCAAELANEMARGPGEGCGQTWSAATIQQYRRMSVAPLERGGPGVCEAVFMTFANNTRMFYENRQICNMPISCKPENFDDLPDLPSPD